MGQLKLRDKADVLVRVFSGVWVSGGKNASRIIEPNESLLPLPSSLRGAMLKYLDISNFHLWFPLIIEKAHLCKSRQHSIREHI